MCSSGSRLPKIPDATATEISPQSSRRTTGRSPNTANLEISPLFNITSITGYRSVDFYQQSDGDSTAANITRFLNATRDKQFSQELRVAGEANNFNYLVGAYYFHDKFDFDSQTTRNPVTTGGPNFLAQGLRQIARQKTVAKALFG